MPRRPRSTKTPTTAHAPPRQTPSDRARAWWSEHAKADRYVVSPTTSPSPAVTRVLRQEHLVMEVAGRRAWILTATKPVDRRVVFLANYWPIVALVLERYTPAAVEGLAAVKLHLGDFSSPEILPVYHDANQSEYTLKLEPGFSLRLRPGHLPREHLAHIQAPGRAVIPVLAAPDLLATLTEPELTAGIEPIGAWLRHLVIRGPDLERAVNDWPRPQVLQRLADVAQAIGNRSLARQLDQAARRVSERTATPARTGVGTRIQLPSALLEQPPGTGSPWVDAQAMRLTRQSQEIATHLGGRIASLPRFRIERLVANATESKAYDAYHSTTLEGYRITPDVVEAIVQGSPLPDGPQSEESLRSAMAVQGYSGAFDRALRLARQRAPITGAGILDLYEELFRPSVDAGIVSPGQLRGWRTAPVTLSGWRHVPPNHKKIRDLIDGLEAFAALTDLDPVTKAMLVHLEFVTIHPFLDGNGRLGRLLMNWALVSGGLPWVTVRSDERMPFFKSIERAQVDDDTSAFIRFVWHLIDHAATDLAAKMPRRARRSR
jgi:Fic family protein